MVLSRPINAVALIWAMTLCSCRTGIHLLGIDKHGIKKIKVSGKQYSKRVGNTLADIHDAAIVPANQILTHEDGKKWKVQWFNVGMAIKGKVSIAGIATLGARPRIRLYFSRKKRN